MNLNETLFFSSSVKKFKESIDLCSLLSLGGLNSGEKSLLINLCNQKCIVVCSDFISMTEMKNNLSALGKKVGVISLGISLPIFARHQDTSTMIEFLSNMFEFNNDKIDVLFVMCEALLQKLPSQDFLEFSICFEKNKEYKLKNISAQFISLGYTRKDYVTSKGEFSIRGDIVDVFAINQDYPTRLDFFGDKIEKISKFNIEDMKNICEIEFVDIYPATIFFTEGDDEIKHQLTKSLNNLDKNNANYYKMESIVCELKELIDLNNLKLNSSFILPFFGFKNNILSMFNKELIFFDEPKKIYDDLCIIYKNSQESIFNLISRCELLPIHQKYYFEPLDCFKEIKKYVLFSNYEQNILPFQSKINFRTIGERKYVFDYKSLVQDINMYLKQNMRVILCAGDSKSVESISQFLFENRIKCNSMLDYEQQKAQVVIIENNIPLSASFLDGGLIFIGTDDLVKKSVKKTSQNIKKKTTFYLPKVGDYVVHSIHGIGKCISLTRLNLNGSEKDYFIIEYKGGDKFYLPSEQANSISAFLGGDGNPNLSKIGGHDFAKAKQKVMESVKQLAINLVGLYAEREKIKGHVYESGNYLMDAFENAFSFDETEDQLSAIADIKKDLYSSKIMDRLVCGDVGYGKTEVALRAAYQVILGGKQVAFLCPTTILSQQHFNTSQKRMKDFMVNVQVINRFKTKQQQEQILKDLKDGKIDLLCGTHRLLSQDVKFKDLGLLILDEEQRFGVADKEKIKELKKDVDVLSLSATPIPRTLNMAMTGIRDISIIETPPKNRLPIQTYVTSESDGLIEDACKRELSRGGQVLIVFNRVEKILDVYNKIQNMLPNAKVGYAHGQMPERMLENTIMSLYNGEYDILVATTLIESGIDLPMANTLIVLNSDMLGLAQLYQLRGRIGRSDRLAYAYFLYNPNKVLTADAYKRLDAIMEFNELGSGFKIAMRDLEIRGAGNVLGKEQHGHMEKVGYELYCKLLEDAVKNIKGEKTETSNDIKMDIVCPAFIPDEYIKGEKERIRAYTTISMLENNNDIISLSNEFEDVFGQVPNELLNLMKIAAIKNLTSKIGINRVVLNDQKTILYFENKELDLTNISKAIQKYSSTAVLKIEQMPTICFNMHNMDITNKLDILIDFGQSCLID